MAQIQVSLKSDSKVRGVITQQLGNGFVTVFWDGESEGDYIHISDLNGVIEQEIVEIATDNRTYEFGIGNLSNDDPYYAQTRLRSTGKTKLVGIVKCDCGHTVDQVLAMSSSRGSSCPDCYDRMSD